MDQEISNVFRTIFDHDVNSTNNINALGYLNIIGYNSSEILYGKKLFKKIVKFIEDHQIFNHFSKKDKNTFIFKKLLFKVDKQKWQIVSNIYENKSNKDVFSVNKSRNLKLKDYKRSLFNSVEYGIIIDKNNEININEEIRIELNMLLKKFNNWIEEYFNSINAEFIDIPILTGLLKLIVSN